MYSVYYTIYIVNYIIFIYWLYCICNIIVRLNRFYTQQTTINWYWFDVRCIKLFYFLVTFKRNVKKRLYIVSTTHEKDFVSLKYNLNIIQLLYTYGMRAKYYLIVPTTITTISEGFGKELLDSSPSLYILEQNLIFIGFVYVRNFGKIKEFSNIILYQPENPKRKFK